MEALDTALYEHSKTPVMWLQEICVKQGCALPTYQERDLRSHISEPPNFEVTAKVLHFDQTQDEVSASGCATTKKTAKQRAATALLHLLGITPKDLADIRGSKSSAPSPYSTSKSNPAAAVSPATIAEPMSPVSNGCSTPNGCGGVDEMDTSIPPVTELSKVLASLNISPTSCVELLELVGKRGLPNPEYIELKEEGPPHSRKFYFECRIKNMNGQPDLTVVVSDNQKKKAKNLSAATMILKIQQTVHTNETIGQLIANVEQQFPEPSRAVCTDRKRCHDLVAHLHHRYHSLIGSKILDLHDTDIEEVDCESILKSIAEEETFQFEFIEVPVKNDSEQWQCYCELSYSPQSTLCGPPAVFVGEGSLNSEARKNAAREALRFLKIVSKP